MSLSAYQPFIGTNTKENINYNCINSSLDMVAGRAMKQKEYSVSLTLIDIDISVTRHTMYPQRRLWLTWCYCVCYEYFCYCSVRAWSQFT